MRKGLCALMFSVKMPPIAYRLVHVVLTGEVVLGSCGTYRREGLAGGSGLLVCGGRFYGIYTNPNSSQSVFLS